MLKSIDSKTCAIIGSTFLVAYTRLHLEMLVDRSVGDIVEAMSQPVYSVFSRVTENMVKLESRLPRGRNVTISIIDNDSKIGCGSDKVYS